MQNTTEKSGGIIIRNQAGKTVFYVVHRPRHDDWSFPKGHIDSGETLEQAALREVLEETGFDCKIIRKLPEYTYMVSKKEPAVIHWFEMEVETIGEPQDNEVDRGEWLTLEQLTDMMSYPELIDYIKKIYS